MSYVASVYHMNRKRQDYVYINESIIVLCKRIKYYLYENTVYDT